MRNFVCFFKTEILLIMIWNNIRKILDKFSASLNNSNRNLFSTNLFGKLLSGKFACCFQITYAYSYLWITCQISEFSWELSCSAISHHTHLTITLYKQQRIKFFTLLDTLFCGCLLSCRAMSSTGVFSKYHTPQKTPNQQIYNLCSTQPAT